MIEKRSLKIVFIKILVATHKLYTMPNEDIYLPIHVGREGKENLGYQGDNTGQNISTKNDNYSELTALYWAWKNLDADYVGLCHYRRYFTSKGRIRQKIYKNEKFKLILSKDEIERAFKEYEIIVPKEYYLGGDTVWAHYNKFHNIEDLENVKKIIKNKYPEYMSEFEEVMSKKEIYAYNMFITDKKSFNDYCEWMFNILFELEANTDITSYDSYQKRIYGFISERLFNVWLLKHKLKKKTVNVINMEL
ncbi:DUF4422 domain-containing protein [Neobacillus niacini]|uniref:DUF4422 domain-containing protein n=1 Tax=Neobacillus niacini TaxID=86668 RepID=UPI0027D7CACD|nr:DUF4422 domain-containing protein [Neobacillus niacini]